MHLSVKILGIKSNLRYSVSRLVTSAEAVLKTEYPNLEVEIKELKTQAEICKYTQVLTAPGLVIDEKLVYDWWIPSKEQVLNWMREAIAQKQPGKRAGGVSGKNH